MHYKNKLKFEWKHLQPQRQVFIQIIRNVIFAKEINYLSTVFKSSVLQKYLLNVSWFVFKGTPLISYFTPVYLLSPHPVVV